MLLGEKKGVWSLEPEKARIWKNNLKKSIATSLSPLAFMEKRELEKRANLTPILKSQKKNMRILHMYSKYVYAWKIHYVHIHTLWTKIHYVNINTFKKKKVEDVWEKGQTLNDTSRLWGACMMWQSTWSLRKKFSKASAAKCVCHIKLKVHLLYKTVGTGFQYQKKR